MPRTRVAGNHDRHVRIPKALDQELDWYFSYGEGAKRLGSIAFLPMHETTRLATVDDSSVATQRTGLALATAVQSTLGDMPAHHAAVLRAAFTPRRWPDAVAREFQCLSAIAVRLTCAANPWPTRSNHAGLETAAAHHLAHLLTLTRERARLVTLRKTARRLLGRAILAYVRARTKGGRIAESS